MLEITKNLVNVSKLAKENGAFVEFHADSCLVKDVGIGRVVLKGDLKNGLYKLKTRSFVIGNASSVSDKSLKSENNVIYVQLIGYQMLILVLIC